MKLSPAFLLLLGLCQCGYNWGHQTRQLPDGHKTVFVEMFRNRSSDVGAENAFTNALMRELERSGFAIVTSKDAAEIIIEGEVVSTNIVGTATEPAFRSKNFTAGTSNTYDASFLTIFNLEASTNIRAIRARDQKVVWRSNLKGRRTFRGARLKEQGIRSSNVLYNQSQRKQTMKLIAEEMMSDAFDQLTENF